MSELIHLIIAMTVCALLDRYLKPYAWRKWLGVTLMVIGPVGSVVASQVRWMGLDIGLLSVFAAALGVGLFRRRWRFEAALPDHSSVQ
ncbi:hypothetical protein [Pseudomonas xanthosomatis]|uniref:hypothetical protein n=1 Tax=Pseudomonas xanthosomatis TaxID=2842356 RepID=UPI003513EC8E